MVALTMPDTVYAVSASTGRTLIDPATSGEERITKASSSNRPVLTTAFLARRNEEGLKHGMAWVRHHDKYGESGLVSLG